MSSSTALRFANFYTKWKILDVGQMRLLPICCEPKSHRTLDSSLLEGICKTPIAKARRFCLIAAFEAAARQNPIVASMIRFSEAAANRK